MKIRFRLLLLLVTVISTTVIMALLVAGTLTRTALESNAVDELSAVLEARHSALSRHLDITYRQLAVLSSAPATAKHLAALAAGYAKLGSDAPAQLQQHYPSEGLPTAFQLRNPDYERAYALATPLLLNRNALFKWADLFLIDRQGNVVFSALKRKDFATNLLTGPWKTSGLARAVAPILQHPLPDALSFADFEHYAPAGDHPAAFVAMPVFDESKQTFLGVLAIQLPVQQINELMQDKTGLGASGETFVVGKGGWMLTDSRFRTEGTALGVQLRTQAVTKVLNGEKGLERFPDYRGIEVYVAFKPITPFQSNANLGDHATWGVIAKMDRDEVFAGFYQLREMLLLTGGGLILLAIAISIWGAHGITRPLLAVKEALNQLTRGESAPVPHLDRNDEIGEMAQAAETFRKVSQQVAHDHWIAEGVTQLTHALSVEREVKRAVNSLLHLLCQRLNTPVGAVYVYEHEHYQRMGAYGLARRSQFEDCFALGEGLVGQCAQDNQAVVISPVPSGLMVISSGLAEFTPQELVLYPLSYQNEVIAVLELASLQPLTPLQHGFLKAVTAALGVHLTNLQAAQHNLLLLEETRQQSQELQTQQETLLKSNEEMRALTEELRSQSEEMKTQNEELKASQEELRAQQSELQRKNQLLESQSRQLELTLSDVQRQSSELAQANQYKSEFLANMSHELRTPLNSVLILAKNLAENDAHNLTDEQVESAAVIGESGGQLLTLINDILDLSKIEAGKLELVNETFPIQDLLTYLRRLFSPQAEKKHIGFKVQVESNVATHFNTDRQRLTQVLSNLLSNAIKFTDSGEVSVVVSQVGKALQFAVTDSGIGIPADKLEHIFGTFQQLDGSTSRRYGGSGLGLAISRHLARLLGGEIVVTSQLGQGSRFALTLLNLSAIDAPLQVVSVETEEVVIEVNAMSPLFIVEDDVHLSAILARMIKSLGYAAVCFESAEQALAAITHIQPLGLLLDLGLPKMSGMALLQQLKSDALTAGVPVYVMSGAEDTGEAVRLGALGFLKKPLTRETIASAMKMLLGENPPEAMKRILLVDESADEAQSLQDLFQQDACQFIPAFTGQAALQVLESQHWDAVVLGLNLRDMTGFEWLKQAQHLLNPPPVVVYSARELSEHEVFELKERVESIVIKSASNDRLHEEVLLAAQLCPRSHQMTMPKNAETAQKKLLLVDDDARNLFALTRALRVKGFGVEVAANSHEALEMLSHTRFDAVLTDIMMPDMDGYALMRQIRALGYDDLPIVAITAKAMQGDDALCLQAGATAYLPKPVDMNKLLDLLKKV